MEWVLRTHFNIKKRQGNIISALMSNFDIARETLNTAMNESAGSAERELSNYRQSVQYSLDTFKAQFQELSTSALSSDLFKGAIDSGTGLLNIITKLTSIGDGIPALIAGLSALKSAMGSGKYKVIVINAPLYKIA